MYMKFTAINTALVPLSPLKIRVGPSNIYEHIYTLFRVYVMEAELSVAVDEVSQLQGEKEKALADLNNIRKLNRTIERLVTHT